MRRPAGGGGLGLALVSAAAFGTSGAFAGSLLDAGWTPGAAVTVRVVVAAVVLAVPALLALRGSSGALRRGGRAVAGYGVVAVAGCQVSYFYAVQHLPVAVALLLEYSGVLLVVLWLWLRHGHRPGRLTVFGALLAVLGLALVLDLVGSGPLDAVGMLWGLAAAVGLAVYFVIAAGVPGAQEHPLPPLAVAWGGLTVGAAALGLAGSAGVLPLAAPRTHVTLLHTQVSWLVPVLGLSVVAAALAYATGVAAARRLGATVASFVGLSEVLFAVLFAWLLVDQALRPVQLAGGGLVVAGIALVRLEQLRANGTVVPVATPEQLIDAST